MYQFLLDCWKADEVVMFRGFMNFLYNKQLRSPISMSTFYKPIKPNIFKFMMEEFEHRHEFLDYKIRAIIQNSKILPAEQKERYLDTISISQ